MFFICFKRTSPSNRSSRAEATHRFDIVWVYSSIPIVVPAIDRLGSIICSAVHFLIKIIRNEICEIVDHKINNKGTKSTAKSHSMHTYRCLSIGVSHAGLVFVNIV